MNAIVEAKVADYLRNWLRYDPYACGTILECMRRAATAGGFDLDERFRYANLGSGPEGRIASGIVDRALMGGGCESSDYAMRAQIDNWVRYNPVKGKF
jgi:hypothetical protein